jgi:hypothetical protein
MNPSSNRVRRAVRAGESGRAGSFLLVIVLGVLSGTGWAVYDYRQQGGDVDRLMNKSQNALKDAYEDFSTNRRDPQRPVPPRPPSSPPSQNTSAAVTPPAPKSPAPAAAPAPASNDYSGSEIDSAMRMSFSDIKAGRFSQARDRLIAFDPGRIPPTHRDEFQSSLARASLMIDLLRESNLTPAADPPKLVVLTFKTGKGPFEGTILSENKGKIEFRLLSGITATFDRFEVLQTEPMEPPKARRRVEAEFERRWKSVRDSRPMDAYRLGEFCLKNGLPDRVAECFERAAKRDPNLVATVREEKSQGLYDTFFFFLSIGNLREARQTLDLLRLRYPDSPLIAQAAEVERETAELSKAELRSSIRPKDKPLVAVAPPPGAPAPPPPPENAEEPPPAGQPATNVPGLSADKQSEFRDLVTQANAAYDTAVGHLKRSDPSENPDDWLKENNKALALLNKAYELYNRALDVHNDPSLWDRVRDTNFKRVLAQRRSLVK